MRILHSRFPKEKKAEILVTGTGAWVYPDACPRDYTSGVTALRRSETLFTQWLKC